MLSVSIGPLALPVAPLLLLASIWISALVSARLVAIESRSKVENTVWLAGLLGLLGARLAHVARYLHAYLASPWDLLDVRDGGWWWPGAALGLAWLVWRAWRHRDWRRALLLGALAGGTLWAGARLGLSGAASASQGAGVPDVVLHHPAQTGQTRSLAELVQGRPAVVNLWASWCGPCRVEMPTLARAQQAHPEVAVVFVNQGETPQAVAAYLERSGLSLENVWLDPQRALGAASGSAGLPTTLFLDARGRRVDAHFGVINAAALQVQMDRLRGSR